MFSSSLVVPTHIVLACLMAAFGACSLTSPVPVARVQVGPALDQQPRMIVAVPTSCEAKGTTWRLFGEDVPVDNPEDYCGSGSLRAVESETRMALEFAGYRLIDSEVVNVYMRERLEQTLTTGPGRHKVVEVTSGSWAEASHEERRLLLQEMGVDGILESHLSVSSAVGAESVRTVELSLTLVSTDERALVWRSRCAAITGRYNTFDQAVELAARCALEGARILDDRRAPGMQTVGRTSLEREVR